MSSFRGRKALGVGILLCGIAGKLYAENPHIHPLRIEVRGNEVLINFVLNGALDPTLSRRLESGLETSIDYEMKLEERNRYWFDDFLAARRLRVIAAYDSVRREYVIREIWDGKSGASQTTKEFAEAARLLVSRASLPVFRVLPGWPHKHLYVKMKASYDSGHFFALAPVDSSTEWKKSRTFKIHDADLK